MLVTTACTSSSDQLCNPRDNFSHTLIYGPPPRWCEEDGSLFLKSSGIDAIWTGFVFQRIFAVHVYFAKTERHTLPTIQKKSADKQINSQTDGPTNHIISPFFWSISRREKTRQDMSDIEYNFCGLMIPFVLHGYISRLHIVTTAAVKDKFNSSDGYYIILNFNQGSPTTQNTIKAGLPGKIKCNFITFWYSQKGVIIL